MCYMVKALPTNLSLFQSQKNVPPSLLGLVNAQVKMIFRFPRTCGWTTRDPISIIVKLAPRSPRGQVKEATRVKRKIPYTVEIPEHRLPHVQGDPILICLTGVNERRFHHDLVAQQTAHPPSIDHVTYEREHEREHEHCFLLLVMYD